MVSIWAKRIRRRPASIIQSPVGVDCWLRRVPRYNRRRAPISLSLLPVLTLPTATEGPRVERHRYPRPATLLEFLCLVCVFMLAFEVTFRIAERIRYGTPFFARVVDEEGLVVRDSLGMHGRANVRYQKWSMNELGLRGPSATRIKRRGTLRIITLGASETFGLYEQEGNEYPRALQDTLLRRLSVSRAAMCSGQSVEVLNAATPGMTLPTIAQDVRLRLGSLRPDIVSIYPTPPQYLAPDAPKTAARSRVAIGLPISNAYYPRSLDGARSEFKRLLPDALLAGIAQVTLHTERNHHPAGWLYESVPSDRLGAFESDLRNVVGSIRSIGAKPVLITHGNAFMRTDHPSPEELNMELRFHQRATPHTLLAFDSAARAVTLRVARDSDVTVVDAAQSLSTGRGGVFADFLHFTDYGAARMASVIADSLLPQITCAH
jgi:lysophospholipase L1-like esterase